MSIHKNLLNPQKMQVAQSCLLSCICQVVLKAFLHKGVLEYLFPPNLPKVSILRFRIRYLATDHIGTLPTTPDR